jgi:hypothetical protein
VVGVSVVVLGERDTLACGAEHGGKQDRVGGLAHLDVPLRRAVSAITTLVAKGTASNRGTRSVTASTNVGDQVGAADRRR